jgi:hypothetical protein
MADRTQFYQVTVYGFEKDSTSTPTGKTNAKDITADIVDDVTYTDEDEKIRTLEFSLQKGYIWMDVLSIGMRVDFVGGTLEKSELIITCYIKLIQPVFQDNGDIKLMIECAGEEWKGAAINVNDRIYPSDNCPFAWGRANSLKGSEILQNLAKECGFAYTGNVKYDPVYTRTKPKKQHKMSDFRFINHLTKELRCVFWFGLVNGVNTMFVEDETRVVNKVSDHTFFFPVRVGNEFKIKPTSEKQIQFLHLDLELDTNKAVGDLSEVTDPKTGQPVLGKEDFDGQDWKLWVIDEAKIRALPPAEQDLVFNLTGSGNATWEDVKQFFIPYKITDKSSREPIAPKIEVVNLTGSPTKDGLQSTSTTQSTISDSPANSNDPTNNQANWTFSEKKLKGQPAEKINEYAAKFVRGECTPFELETYFDYKPPNSEKDVTMQPNESVGDSDSGKRKKKRDAGFHITGECYGNLAIQTRLSYYLEGMGKYSTKYYLFRKKFIWGKKGFMMKLTFTK